MKSSLSVLVAFFLIICCGGHSKDKLQAELDAYFTSQFSNDEPGGAVLILKGDRIIFEKGYGIADLQTQEKITPKTVFNTGSISKTFTAYGILILYQEGKLSLDDNLEKYFPEFKRKEIARKVKIYHLLTHSSGLIDSRKTREDSVFYLTAKDQENFFPITQNDSSGFDPGERFRYSNPAFNGLALIIEKITGMKWQKFIQERVFGPAHMPNSRITDGAYPQDGVAHGYINREGTFVESDYGEVPTFCAAGNGGVWSSVEDLANYELALRKAVFLNRELIKKSREVFPLKNWKSEEPPHIGLCWFIGEMNGLKQVGHTGSQGGFRADYVSLPEKELLYICLCNTPKPLGDFRKEVFKMLSENGLLD